MKEQKGYLFKRYGNWFVRFWDTNAEGRRVQVCKKLDVPEGTRRKDAQQFANEKFLDALNSGLLNPQSNMLVTDFVDRVYLPEYVEKNLRPASLKQYRDVWNNHLKPRMGKLTLRSFRTVHGEQILRKIAEQAGLGRSSLRHCKAFLSGAFKQAKRLGILDGLNPIQDVSIPRAPEPDETYAYNLSEIKSMLAMLSEPAHTVVLCAALTGLRKGELMGLRWQDFDGMELTVNRSVWNGLENEPKTKRSRAPIPVVKQLADALEAHKLRAGKLAQATLPIFQAGNGKPMRLDNLARRVIIPTLSRCVVCGKPEDEHKPEGHLFERDNSLPHWHGWHSFRRGLATNLHALGIPDKEIQGILRHSNIGITQAIYIKSVSESQISAMDSLSEKLESCKVN